MFYSGDQLFLGHLKYLIFISIIFCFAGCDWEPDHSNPLDPANPYYQKTGNLRLKVYPLDWHDAPITGVTVLIEQLSRFGVTDSIGEVFFDQVPADTIVALAYRNGDSEVIYALDSIEVIIEPGKTTFDSLNLDAVPIIDSCKVNSITLPEDDNTRVFARLTAWVRDPDGNTDLKRVKYSFQGLNGELNYSLDSSYWRIEIPSEDFPGNDLRNTLSIPFVFEAFDTDENSSKVTSLLVRVINGVPVINDELPLTLTWYYALWDQLPNTESFFYLVRIFTADVEPRVVYERLATPNIGAYNNHPIEITLDYGAYFWHVWVIDLFGNMSRSKPQGFTIEPPPSFKTNKE